MNHFNLDIPVIGILRGVTPDFFKDIMAESFAAGLQALEVTMNTENALSIIEKNRPLVPEGKFLGAGTVRNLAEAQKGVEAGAMFMVTPNLDEEVIAFARQKAIPIITGALTPTEIYKAWTLGASMVKVFPCQAFGGPAYIKEIRAPLEKVPLVAVGGVTLDSLPAYFQAGARAVGVATALFGREALHEQDIDGLSQNVKRFIGQCRALKEGGSIAPFKDEMIHRK